MAVRQQIKHIEEHQAAFDRYQCTTGADVEAYFEDYAYVTDLYTNLCTNLAITPRDFSES